MYSGHRTGILSPQQPAPVPRRESPSHWFHKEVYLHANLHEVKAILKARALTLCNIIPSQKPEPDQPYTTPETHRNQLRMRSCSLNGHFPFQLQARHRHAGEAGKGQPRKPRSLIAGEETDHLLQDFKPLHHKAQLPRMLLYPHT